MRSSTVLVVCVAIGLQAVATRAGEFTPPPGVGFPITVQPIQSAESAWVKQGDVWVLEAGRSGYLHAPAWWEGNRPPRDQMVVLEIEYLDNMKHAVAATIYSGLGSENPYSELHRFGGVGDNRWKTARIPASADFIFKYLPDSAVRFRLTPNDGSLQIRKASLVAPNPDEESRYNSESREWVRREQLRAEVSERFWRLAQIPVLPGEWAGRKLVPFARSWMDLILPISTPQGREAGAPLETRMFLNEYEPLQVGVYANGSDLKEVSVTVDPIVDSKGRIVAEADVRVAEYSKVGGMLIPGYLVQVFPQRLWPAYPFDVESGKSHLVWIVLHTREEQSRPGTYTSQVHFGAQGQPPVSVPLKVEILNSRLLTMDEADLKLGGCTTGLVPEFELEFLHDYNHNMVNIWYASVRPQLRKEGGTFEMDYRIMDDWMAAAKRQGMNDMVYFLGGNPYGFPQTMHLPRTLARTLLGIDDQGWRKLALTDPFRVPDEVASSIREWSRRFGEHAEAADWPNVILTPFDEPAKYVQYRTGMGMLFYIKPQFKQQIELLREGDPDVQIYGSIHNYEPGIEFVEDVDIFCTNAVHENWGMPDEVRAAGKTLWEYSGTSDKGLPGVARYTFGYYFAAHNSRGSLVWAYNWGNRFDTLDGSNWMYAWNTPFDVIPTPYMEGLREAWDDRRLLETLKQTAAEKNIDLTDFLSRLFAEVAMARGRGGTSTVDDFWERAKADLVMDQWKNRMIEKLLEIQAGH
ncbi:MAG TPA: hypothetical protein PLM33_01045 [Acidobacteriota bacterium]|nr:hypothetical protein [Acidobacteriota bacterium]HRV08655.1 hypothetical protein [Acidobacteriota bacterium]